MASNVSEQFCLRVSTMDLKTICQIWRPPPLPSVHESLVKALYSLAANDDNYKCYSSVCPGLVVDPDIYRSTTPVFQAGAGPVVAIVISVVFVIFVAIALGYLWYRKKHRSARTGTLRTSEYENTNYLDNKARNGLCWRPQQRSTDDKNEQYEKAQPNKYGSLPHKENTTSVMYIINYNSTINFNGDIVLGPPPVFNPLFPSLKGTGSDQNGGIANDDFVNGGSEMDSPSPSANSNTPLFDDVDGVVKRISDNLSKQSDSSKRNSDSLLLNVPSHSTTDKFSRNLIHAHSDLSPQNSVSATTGGTDGAAPPNGQGTGSRPSGGSRLPPLDQSQRRSPKKKPSYLSRKSAPLESQTNEAYGEEADNNRKSM